MCFKTGLKAFPEIINKVTERERRQEKDKNRLSSQQSLYPNKGDYRKHNKVGGRGNQGNNPSQVFQMKNINSQITPFPAQRIMTFRNIRKMKGKKKTFLNTQRRLYSSKAKDLASGWYWILQQQP